MKWNTRISKMIGLLVVVVFGIPTMVSSHDRGETPIIHLSVLLDLDGGQATLGQPAMNGFFLALQQADLQQASKIFTTFLNTKSDPTITLSAAISVQKNVSVGAGFTDNDSVLTAGPIFQERKVPFLSIGATDPSLPAFIGNYIFLTPFGDNTQAAAAAEFSRKEFGDSVAILFDNTAEYTRTLHQYFRTRFEELGGDVLFSMDYPGGCSIASLGQQMLVLPELPSFVYLAGLPDCIGEIVASLRSVGIHQPIIGGDGLDTANLLTGGNGPTDNVWYTTHAWLSPETGTPTAKEFIERYREVYGTTPQNAFAALGYDAANLLLEALKQTRKGRSREIFEALERTQDFNGVTGNISFNEESHVPLKTVWTIQVTEGELSLADAFIPESIPPPIQSTKTKVLKFRR